MKKLWHNLFLIERPSIGLSFFRIAVALTTGFHVIPSLLHLEENYFSTAFKTFNPNFFTIGFIEWIQKSPDGLVVFFAVLFGLSCFLFLLGCFSQISCIAMTVCCYYFYALNTFYIGTLSWDILLVTLFLMCVTPYHGDYFSVDCLWRKDVYAYQRKRPFFLQRLLQLQIASTFFYTALHKITAQGNWLTDNPIYYLMNYPPEGVVKHFLLKDFLAQQPQLCYGIGVGIVIAELALPFLFFIPKTRRSAIYLGFIFHILLILTLDVPAIFFFLFPPQLLLFINPDRIIQFLEQKRSRNLSGVQDQVIYDGRCQFCRASVQKLEIMDLLGTLKMLDYQQYDRLTDIHPQLTKEQAASQLHLVTADGTLYGGFFAFRILCFKLPMLYVLLPILYFPGIALIGPFVYRWIAKNRYLFHFNPTCQNNACFR